MEGLLRGGDGVQSAAAATTTNASATNAAAANATVTATVTATTTTTTVAMPFLPSSRTRTTSPACAKKGVRRRLFPVLFLPPRGYRASVAYVPFINASRKVGCI